MDQPFRSSKHNNHFAVIKGVVLAVKKTRSNKHGSTRCRWPQSLGTCFHVNGMEGNLSVVENHLVGIRICHRKCGSATHRPKENIDTKRLTDLVGVHSKQSNAAHSFSPSSGAKFLYAHSVTFCHVIHHCTGLTQPPWTKKLLV